MGIGFFCSDGIVLCADTQITWKDHKAYECKIHPVGGIDWVGAFTYAGNPHLVKSFKTRFLELLPNHAADGGNTTTKEIREIIETALCFFDELRNDPTALTLLFGVGIPQKGMRLFRTEGQVVSDVQLFDYVGCGDSSLLRCLGPLLIDKDEALTMSRALIVGTYLVLKAKTYVQDCGGDTDAFTLSWAGRMQTRSGMTYNWEQHSLRLERDVSKVLRSIGDDSVTNEDASERMDILCKRIREERQINHR